MAEINITPDMVINEVIKQHPWTLPVFHRYGVDSCCGGAHTLTAAAQENNLNLDDLMAELAAAAEAAQAGPAG